MSSDIDHNFERCCDYSLILKRFFRKVFRVFSKKHKTYNKMDGSKLNVLCMISNPVRYRRRIELANKFIRRMKERNDINLYIAEIAYNDHTFQITDSNNPNHLQLRSKYPMWHKENAINILVRKKLEPSWKSFCWIDMDVIFESKHWVEDTLELLNVEEPRFVQLFSHAVDMNYTEDPMSIFQSFGYQLSLGKTHDSTKKGFDYWHPGYAWGMNRAAYDLTGGLYERSIIGSGDYNMAMSLIGKGSFSIDRRVSNGYKNSIDEYQARFSNIVLKHTPGVIRHEYHGSKVNRKYVQRNDIIIKHCYDPNTFLENDENGLLQPTSFMSKDFLDDIMNYFVERNEDENN